MDSTKYVGMDVHTETTSIAVMNSAGPPAWDDESRAGACISLRIDCLLASTITWGRPSGSAGQVNGAGSLQRYYFYATSPDRVIFGCELFAVGMAEINMASTSSLVNASARVGTLFLTSDEAIFALRGNEAKDDASGVSRQLRPSSAVPTIDAVLRMKLVKANANPAVIVTGADELPGKSNHFIGNDPKSWRSNVTNYAKVKYEGIYSGIDLVYYGNQRQLEYDFVVAPGADPRRIQFDVRGAKRISRDEHGGRDDKARCANLERKWRQCGDGKEHEDTPAELCCSARRPRFRTHGSNSAAQFRRCLGA